MVVAWDQVLGPQREVGLVALQVVVPAAVYPPWQVVVCFPHQLSFQEGNQEGHQEWCLHPHCKVAEIRVDHLNGWFPT